MPKGQKIGLVLEGGGMRGLYTAGVIDILLDNAFRAAVICGTSAGVTFGVNLPSKQRGRVLRYTLNHIGRRDYVSWWSFLTTGNVVGTEFAYNKLPRILDPFDNKAFMDSGTEFYATVTNVLTGRPEYLRIDNPDEQMDRIRASASLPFMSRKVYLDGVPYLDGGMTDNIPFDKCMSLGCDKVVVVLTHPESEAKSGNLDILCKLFYPSCKALAESCSHRAENYQRRMEQITRLEKEGKIFVIRPSRLVKVGRLEKNHKRIKEIYNLGLEDATGCMEALTNYLQK